MVFFQVFNTYQTYLKVRVVLGLGSTLVVVALCQSALAPLCQGMPTRVQRDLDRSRRNLGMFWETPPRMLCNRGNEGLGWDL